MRKVIICTTAVLALSRGTKLVRRLCVMELPLGIPPLYDKQHLCLAIRSITSRLCVKYAYDQRMRLLQGIVLWAQETIQ